MFHLTSFRFSYFRFAQEILANALLRLVVLEVKRAHFAGNLLRNNVLLVYICKRGHFTNSTWCVAGVVDDWNT